MTIVSDTSNIPQNDTAKYLGLHICRHEDGCTGFLVQGSRQPCDVRKIRRPIPASAQNVRQRPRFSGFQFRGRIAGASLGLQLRGEQGDLCFLMEAVLQMELADDLFEFCVVRVSTSNTACPLGPGQALQLHLRILGWIRRHGLSRCCVKRLWSASCRNAKRIRRSISFLDMKFCCQM